MNRKSGLRINQHLLVWRSTAGAGPPALWLRSVAVPGHSKAKRAEASRTSQTFVRACIAAPGDGRTPVVSRSRSPLRAACWNGRVLIYHDGAQGTDAPYHLDCGDTSPLSDWETCLPVPKRGRVRALQTLRAVGRAGSPLPAACWNESVLIYHDGAQGTDAPYRLANGVTRFLTLCRCAAVQIARPHSCAVLAELA